MEAKDITKPIKQASIYIIGKKKRYNSRHVMKFYNLFVFTIMFKFIVLFFSPSYSNFSSTIGWHPTIALRT